MKTAPLTITTPAGSYPIIVGDGVLQQLPEQLAALGLRGTLWLISDSAVSATYGSRLETALRSAGYTLHSYSVPSGEASKELAMAAQLYTWLISGGVERRDTVIALGGGVIGDLAGFVAATILRGVAFIQLPTTLLAMVDSAIGGKTGINHPLGKNLIGAFHQPRLVLSDTETLRSLPQRELQSGWAEVIKHGVIRDAALFEWLEAWQAGRGSSQAISFPELIRQAVKVKVDVVNIDEREIGERMLLNYGHTLGHAVEAAAGYGPLLHGEAVAIGMHLEAQLAEQLGMVDRAFVERQCRLLQTYGLPTAVPAGISTDTILQLTLRDKKVRAGKIRWVLPTGIGGAAVRDDVPEELVRIAMRKGMSP